MTKKSVICMLTIMFVALFSMTTASCSSDSSEGNVLVGFWEGDHSESYFEDWTFNSDGTGTREVRDGDTGWTRTFKYTIISQHDVGDPPYAVSGDFHYIDNADVERDIHFFLENKIFLRVAGQDLVKRK